MASVQALHPVPAPTDSSNDVDSPTTPRLHQMNQTRIQHIHIPTQKEEENIKTPTTASFAEANGKRSLPLSPPPPAHASIAKHVIGDAMSDDGRRPVSQRSNRSTESSDLHGAEGSHTSPENDASDIESGDDDTSRPTKKKKGQRFFCTEYPPCNLSFTRSEHLARHIRKHTGERPFQCHCNRRFSRLDNLRQHAQTVHVNEEIPTDSLAATGTRFQRQIRTDRVRPPGARSRASTTSSVASHGRGHSRNLSTSSIASTASNMSTISSISQDPRMHPHPLMMAPEQRTPASLTIDTHRASTQYGYTPTASAGPSTPTSTNYSANPGSPYSSYSTITSPASTSRYPSYEGARHARRLSVPNGPSPYHASYQQAPVSPANPSYILTASSVASPTGSVFSTRQEISPAEAEMRRRTWHPSTFPGYSYQRPATSGLSYSQTPDAPQPAAAPQATAAASQPVTLPGFKELVTTIARPATPPGQVSGQQLGGSPGQASAVAQGASSDRGAGAPTDRPAHRSWDVSLHQNLNRLDIASGTPPREVGGWGQQTISDINHAASAVQGPQSGHLQPPNQSHHAPPSQQAYHQQPLLGPALHPVHGPTQHAMETEPSSPSHGRRQGWYQGPVAAAPHTNVIQQPRISPASSISEGVPTPSNPSFEHHPTILHSNGYVEPARIAPQPQLHQAQHSALQPSFHPGPYGPVAPKTTEQPPLTGLDALVAVATSQSQGHDGRR